MSSTIPDIQHYTVDSKLSDRIKEDPANTSQDMQIVRVHFDDNDPSKDGAARENELIIAIDRQKNTGFSDSMLSSVFDAYPIILQTGTIDKESPLVIKIVRNSERTFSDGEKKSQPEYTTHWQRAVPNKTNLDKPTEIEAKNNSNTGLYSRTGLILKKEEISGEATFCERVLLMPKAPGLSLAKLTEKNVLWSNLTREQMIWKRIWLSINIIDYYDLKLHGNEKGPIIHRDIKSENIVVDPNTLLVTVFDINPSSVSYLSKAPEDPGTSSSNFGTIESDIYSLAQDLLTIVFSGIRISKDEYGNITNYDDIDSQIIKNFTKPPLFMVRNSVSDTIIALLETMRDEKPRSRGTLKEARNTLIALIKEMRENESIDAEITQFESMQSEARQAHEAQLQILKTVLENSIYSLSVNTELSTSKKPLSENTFRFLAEIKTRIGSLLHKNDTVTPRC